MFYKLLFKRSIDMYRRSYKNILFVFTVAVSVLSFLQIYIDSCYNYDYAVTIPMLTDDFTCDIRLENLPASELHLYNNIDHIEMTYENGNLDINILDMNYSEEVREQIIKTFNSIKREHIHEETSPHIRMFYSTIIENLYESLGESVEPATTALQILLTVFAIISMTQIYNNYIEERSGDIRTLVSLGINEKRLSNYFSLECTVLYLISSFIGMIFGGIVAYLFFLPGKIFNSAESNWVFPVFKINIKSIFLIFIIGFLAVNIAFRFVLNKILKIDASYTCADSIVEFNPDKSRMLYYKRKGSFKKFFSTVLSKRSSRKIKRLRFITTLMFAFSVLAAGLVGVCIVFYGFDSQALAATLSNFSIFLIVEIYTLVFALSLLYAINKQQVESFSSSAVLMYTLGAKEDDIYNCLRSYIKKSTIVSLIIGSVIGIVISSAIAIAEQKNSLLNIFSLLGIAIIAAIYYAVSIKSLNNSYTEIIKTKINGGN